MQSEQDETPHYPTQMLMMMEGDTFWVAPLGSALPIEPPVWIALRRKSSLDDAEREVVALKEQLRLWVTGSRRWRGGG